MSEEFDVVVIGGGPAGYHAAIRVAQLGGRAVVVESAELGGTCTNKGCIPTKALRKSAEVLSTAKRAKEFGVLVNDTSIDFMQMMKRKDRVVKQVRAGVEILLNKRDIRVVKGVGRVVKTGVAEATLEDGEREQIKAGKIIIATGSVPAKVPIPGIDLPGVMTSDDALELEDLPSNMVIVGGGAIGLEFAYIFSQLGVKVTVVELMPQILPLEDEEMVAELHKTMRRYGIKIHTAAKVTNIEGKNGRLLVKVSNEEVSEELEVDKVLVAVGRAPKSDNLGLEELGVQVERGRILVDEHMETNVKGIYAAGDVISGYLLAHVAFAEGVVAAENALRRDTKIDYWAVPRCIYTWPQLASVGFTERGAIEAGYEVKVGRFPFAAAGMATTIGERTGLVKVVAEKGTGKILGVHIVGAEATELIAEATMAMQLRATVKDLSHLIHSHPTLSEAVGEAILDVSGEAVHKV